nr:NAD(P)-dependent oxidoreductase [Bacilli bacterium]
MKKILLTGAKGFVGKNLYNKILHENRYEVTALGHKELDLFDEQRVKCYFQEHQYDFIIDASVAGNVRPSGNESNDLLLLNQNLRMFYNLVNYKNDNAKLIYFGSGAEYDKRYPNCKVNEDKVGHSIPADSYGFAKYMMSHYASNHAEITCLRIFGLYGPFEDYAYKFISNSIVKTLFKMPIIIHQNVIFDYLYIDDLTSIIVYMLENWPRNRVINVTPTESIDLIKISQIIQKIHSCDYGIQVTKEGLNNEYTGDNKKLLEEISPFSFTSYYDGITKLTEYYRAIRDRLDESLIRNDQYFRYTEKRNSRK